METDLLFLIGRLIFAGYWIYNGYVHFKNAKSMAGYVASKEVPFPEQAIYLSGAFILLGGIGILFGIFIRLAIALIAIFLIVVTYKMHDYWNVSDEKQKTIDFISFYKNMALLGATLMLLAIPIPWLWSLQ